MKGNFAEYYSRIHLGASSDQLEKRWQGIEQYCKKEDLDILQVTNLHFGVKVEETFFSDFVNNFNDIDISFTRSNVRETQILAGTILLYLMEQENTSQLIALTILCLSRYNFDTQMPEVIEKAYQLINNASADTREHRSTLEAISTKSITTYDKGIKDVSALDPTQITGLSSALNAVASCLDTLNNNQKKIMEEINIVREDSNILAWLIGEWCNTLNEKITKKTISKSIALVIAKELADLVEVFPGPYAARSFISKMLNLCKNDAGSYTLLEIIDTLSKDLKTSILSKYCIINESANSTPILFSIKCALDAGANDVWKHSFSNSIGFSLHQVENCLLDWAELLYWECILSKFYEE